MGPSNNTDEGNNNSDDGRPFSSQINKRPNKGLSHSHSRSHGDSIHPNNNNGIGKNEIPANKLKNPTWDPYSRRWVEGAQNPPVYEEDSKHTQLGERSEIHGVFGNRYMHSRWVSSSSIKPWLKYPIIRVDSRRPSHSRPHGQGRGGRRTHKHKRKNKHTRRRRRVQRRRRA